MVREREVSGEAERLMCGAVRGGQGYEVRMEKGEVCGGAVLCEA